MHENNLDPQSIKTLEKRVLKKLEKMYNEKIRLRTERQEMKNTKAVFELNSLDNEEMMDGYDDFYNYFM